MGVTKGQLKIIILESKIFLRILSIVRLVLPRWFRRYVITTMLLPEFIVPPRESIRWLLGVHDYVESTIDFQCMRWGNGIHIKHELMDGIHSFFYERIPEGTSVLDVGCGYGAVAHSIVTHVDARVIGIDVSEKQIAFARQRFTHPNLQFEVGDVTEDLPAERVDVVVFSSVLEHIPMRIELLKKLIDRYNPRLFLIRVPTFERHFFAALKRELGLFPYTDPTHVVEYTPGLFVSEMNEAGLDIRFMEIRWGDIWAECVPRWAMVEANG